MKKTQNDRLVAIYAPTATHCPPAEAEQEGIAFRDCLNPHPISGLDGGAHARKSSAVSEDAGRSRL